ncbi:hypothetical protein [Dyadobacter aurulentus]|uniref:hypothetical protein n=1 Tax=Dyadobacter sp. UC 10 TaxID=2605428 RepID=UPI001788C3BA|nr:hypothetical protein [Dyadobacter sp. UC 10]
MLPYQNNVYTGNASFIIIAANACSGNTENVKSRQVEGFRKRLAASDVKSLSEELENFKDLRSFLSFYHSNISNLSRERSNYKISFKSVLALWHQKRDNG